MMLMLLLENKQTWVKKESIRMLIINFEKQHTHNFATCVGFVVNRAMKDTNADVINDCVFSFT